MGLVLAAYTIAQIHLTLGWFGGRAREFWALIGQLLVPFVVCAAACVTLEAWWPLPEHPSGLLAVSVGRTVVAVGLVAWLFREADRRLGFSHILRAAPGQPGVMNAELADA